MEQQAIHAKGGRVMSAFLVGTVRFVIRWRRAILAVGAAVFVFSVVGITKVNVDANWLNDFRDSLPLKKSTIYVDEVMGGVTNLVLLFDAGEPEAQVQRGVASPQSPSLDECADWHHQNPHEQNARQYQVADHVQVWVL